MYNAAAAADNYICNTYDDNPGNPKRNETKTLSAMIEITADIYRLVAAHLRDRIAASDWFNGTVSGILPVGENMAGAGISVEWRLTLTAIVYRRTEIFPEGARRPISDIVPVWWEFSTTDLDGDRDDSADAAGSAGADRAPGRLQKGQHLNDFSFTELKPFLIDYD